MKDIAQNTQEFLVSLWSLHWKREKLKRRRFKTETTLNDIKREIMEMSIIQMQKDY